jgi:peptide deformylase
MAILRVVQIGHPVLRMVAEPVDPSAIPTPRFQQFCDDLLETMFEYEGQGLAAPQVYTPIRMTVLTLSEERGPEFFINPRIDFLTTETMRFYEGCLSIEGMRAAVDRCSHIRVEALDRNGEVKVLELKGFPAVVVQHECDHLDGVLFVDRCDTTTLAFLSEFRRFGPLDRLGEEDAEDAEEAEDLDEIQTINAQPAPVAK